MFPIKKEATTTKWTSFITLSFRQHIIGDTVLVSSVTSEAVNYRQATCGHVPRRAQLEPVAPSLVFRLFSAALGSRYLQLFFTVTGRGRRIL